MLYNLSEFLTMLKEDIGIMDLPLPVSDAELTNRFAQSALKEFSLRCPRREQIKLNSQDCILMSSQTGDGSVVYKIPKFVYQDATIVGIVDLRVGATGGFSDYYVPSGSYGSADMVLETIADIRLAASLGAITSHSPTFEFMAPDKLRVWHGWYGGTYIVDILLTHDSSLSTVPPTAMSSLRQLAQYDLEEYLYNKLKRKDQLDVGIGTIQLKVDEWSNSGEKKRDLLKDWDENGYNLDIDLPVWYN